jgi:hypothetical protein
MSYSNLLDYRQLNHLSKTKTSMLQKLLWPKWILFFLPCFLIGCGEIRLVGAYDQTVDQSIQKTSADVAKLFVTLEKNLADNNSAANAYTNFRDTYIDIEAEIETIKIRTGALPKYGKVNQQVVLLQQNVQLLEQLHKSNFVQPGKNPIQAIGDLKTMFEVSFGAMLTALNALKREKAN